MEENAFLRVKSGVRSRGELKVGKDLLKSQLMCFPGNKENLFPLKIRTPHLSRDTIRVAMFSNSKIYNFFGLLAE